VTIYALCSVALIGFGILALVVGQNWQLFWFCVLIALYCGALAWAGSRIRSESPGHRASAWLLAPVLLHALVGLAGTSSLLWVGLRAHDAVAPGTLLDVALAGSMLGMVFGWAPALSPLFYGRRGGWFFLAALSGPGLLVALVLLGEQRWM
jgi:hypothetical protein